MLHAVDRRTGKGRWTYNAVLDGGKPEFHGRPLVTGDLIVLGSDDRRSEGIGHVYAFERSTLRLVWKYRAGAGVMSGIVQLHDIAYVTTLNDEVVALDLRNGAVRWKFAGGASNPSFLPNSTPRPGSGWPTSPGANDGSAYAPAPPDPRTVPAESYHKYKRPHRPD